MSMIPREEQAYMESQAQSGSAGVTSKAANVFNDEDQTPFGIGSVEGINAGIGEHDWIVSRSKHEYDQIFTQLSPQNGKISGASARQEMIKSKLVGDLCVVVARFQDALFSPLLAEQCSGSYMETEWYRQGWHVRHGWMGASSASEWVISDYAACLAQTLKHGGIPVKLFYGDRAPCLRSIEEDFSGGEERGFCVTSQETLWRNEQKRRRYS